MVLRQRNHMSDTQFGAQLEKLIDATPDGRKRVAAIRERMKSVRATLAQQQAQAQTAS